ncbi:MAG: DUF4115 domain-containing protein [Alphaproteobacteria bacterium]|nr:MAG: DUF4115 domain-containing protein [Alphaproteobacteria bacterium]
MTEENNNINTEIENTQEVQTITIGELLRKRREERGLNLKTISQQTKVHMALLEHLENNELAKLPSKTYVRGFVKSAAKILNIDQEYALNILEATYNRDQKVGKKEVPSYEMRNETARNTLSSIAATPLETVRSVTASSSAFLAKSVVGILVIGVIVFNVKNLIDRSAEEKLKLPEVLSTIHQKIKPAPKSAETKDAAKDVKTDAPAIVDPIQVNIIQDKKDLNLKSELKINDINLKNISLGEKQFTEDNSLTGESLNAIFPPRYKVQVTKGVENVFINAVDGDSWITYKVDDKDIKKFVLRQGRTIFLRGGTIRLFFGNSNAVKIIYNNKLINLNSKTGVKSLVLPDELKTKYMAPLFVFQKDGTVVTSEELIKSNQPVSPPAPAKPTAPVKNL